MVRAQGRGEGKGRTTRLWPRLRRLRLRPHKPCVLPAGLGSKMFSPQTTAWAENGAPVGLRRGPRRASFHGWPRPVVKLDRSYGRDQRRLRRGGSVLVSHVSGGGLQKRHQLGPRSPIVRTMRSMLNQERNEEQGRGFAARNNKKGSRFCTYLDSSSKEVCVAPSAAAAVPAADPPPVIQVARASLSGEAGQLGLQDRQRARADEAAGWPGC